MPKPSGNFGVGCRSVFTKTGTHCLVFYPVRRKDYEKAMKNDDERMPWRVFGDAQKIAHAKYEDRMLPFRMSGVLHYYDGLTMPAWKNGPLDPSVKKLAPYVFNHGFGQENCQYSG